MVEEILAVLTNEQLLWLAQRKSDDLEIMALTNTASVRCLHKMAKADLATDTTPQPQEVAPPPVTKKRRPMSAAEKKAISKRMKAYWKERLTGK